MKISNQVEKPERVLYRPRTVAEIADLSVSQVYKLIENGTLKSVRIGKSVRVPADALNELIAVSTRA
jgi:excisionase family DNA binding protein